MPQKVAIYIRVSTQEQAQEGYSIEAQTDRLTAYCKAKDWPIVDVYKDPGFSGSNTQRPALQRLLDDIKENRVDCVLVYKLDRLSRSQKDTLFMIEDVFNKHDVAFVSMQENFDTSTPFGRAMIGILSVFAQLEREQIKERMAMGRAERAKNGLWHGGGWRPFGYDYIGGFLQVNPAEAVIIREVYSLFLIDTPITRIATVINQKYGIDAKYSLIRSILSTPLYTGVISWEGRTYPGQHEAIVDNETFKQAQIHLNDRARIAASKPFPFKSTSLLGGLLFCGNCGAAYFSKGNYSGHGVKKQYRPYYYCYSRAKISKHKILDPNCKNPVYPVEELDKQILSEIERLVSDNKYFNSFIKHETPKRADRREEDRRALMLRIDDIDHQISRVIDLYQVGTIGIDDIGRRTQKLQEEREVLQKTLDSLKQDKQEEKLSPAEARTILAEFSSVMATGDLDAKKSMLQILIQKIIVKPNPGEVDIIWNF